MGNNGGQVRLVEEPWNAAAEAELTACYEFTPHLFEAHKQDILRGVSTLRGTYEDGKRVGTCVTRIDSFPGGAKEYVVVAGFARAEQANILGRVFQLLEQKAKVLGCRAMRVYTVRRGLVVKLEELGYGMTEWSLGKGL